MNSDQKPTNADQREFWNERAGLDWVHYQRQLDGQIRILGETAMDRAGIQAGHKVLDVGCGCGDSALELARRVGAGGSVEGIDISQPMLDHARHRAGLEPALRISFERHDAQTAELPPAQFDRAFSRFGVMFFDGPVAAFGNIRTALTAEGRLTFVCWRALEENPWMAVPLSVALKFVAPAEPIPPGVPGPFALAEPGRAQQILESSGYRDISVEALDQAIYLSGPGTLEAATAHTCRMGPVARTLGDADEATVARVETALVAALAPYHDGTGVRMPSACWIVSAAAG